MRAGIGRIPLTRRASSRLFHLLALTTVALLLPVGQAAYAQRRFAFDESNSRRDALDERIRRLESSLKRLERERDDYRRRLKRSNSGGIRQIGHSYFPDDDKKTSSDDSRLKKIEDYINKEKKAAAKKKADAAKKPTFKIGGRIHADYWGFPVSSSGIGFLEHPDPTRADFGNDPENRFLFRRIRLEMRGDILENMMWRMQVEFDEPRAPEIRDVWIGFKNLPCNHELLIGNQKRPLGLDHLNSSRFNIFHERPLVIEAFNEDARRPGITLYGTNEDNSWNWAYGMYLLENIQAPGSYIGDSTQASGNARIWNSPIYEDDGATFLHWAIAGMIAKPDGDVDPGDTNRNEGRFRTRPEARSSIRWIDTGRIPGADWYEILGLEFMYNEGPFHITAEYQGTWMQRDNRTVGTGPDLFFHGAYFHVAYFLTGEHMTYNRLRGTLGRLTPNQNFFLADWCRGCEGHGWGAWQVAFRLSYLDISDADILGGKETNVELGLNWHWTPYSQLQFGLIYGDIDEHRPVGGHDGGTFLIAGARFQADF